MEASSSMKRANLLRAGHVVGGGAADSSGSGGWLWNVLIPLAVLGTGVVMYNLSGGEEELSMAKQEAAEAAAMLAARSMAASSQGVKGSGILIDEGGGGGGEGGEEDDVRFFYETLEKRLDQQTKDLEKAVAEAITMLSSQEQPQWAKDLIIATSSLADEVKSMKGQLANATSRRERDNSSSGAEGGDVGGDGSEESSRENMVTAPGNDEVVKVPLPTLEERLIELRSALAELVAKNSVEQLRSGCSTLIMYVSKLIEQPDVPRYRRVSVTNQTFKTLVLPLHEHERVLAAVGFVKRGAYFEWNWAPAAKPAEETKEAQAESHPASKVANAVEDMSMEILKTCIKLIEPHVAGESGNGATLTSKNHASSAESAARQDSD